MSSVIDKIEYIIAKIDSLISLQLSEILQHAAFHRLEASWRSLWHLCQQVHSERNIIIRVLAISLQTLRHDVMRAIEFDQSQLFRKIYNQEFGMPGGQPYGVLIGDFYFSAKVNDIELLRRLSQIASASFAPFIGGSSATMFGLDDLKELGMQPNIEQVFAQVDYLQWQKLRQEEDSRFLGLTLPRQIIRLPYSQTHYRANTFMFTENKSECNYLWANAAYSFASVLINAFSEHGWLGNIRGFGEQSYQAGEVKSWIDVKDKPQTEAIITDSQEKNFTDLGFIPLCQPYGSRHAVFYSNASIQKSKRYQKEVATLNAYTSSMLQYLLCACRFAHYIKIIVREKVGSFNSALQCQRFLNEWLRDYVAGNGTLPISQRARYPLQQAQVNIKEMVGKPGIYQCILHIKPYFQLERLQSNVVLVTELTI